MHYSVSLVCRIAMEQIYLEVVDSVLPIMSPLIVGMQVPKTYIRHLLKDPYAKPYQTASD